MLAKICSYSIAGLDAYPVMIEVHVSSGLPAINIVGLPDSAVRESKERVRSAIKNSGYKFPSGRITINLSPADIKKEGPSFDLAIALGILVASGQIEGICIDKYIILGELSLDGYIQPIKGVVAIAMSIPKDRFKGVILSEDNSREAALSENIPVFPLRSLKDVIFFFQNTNNIKPFCLELSSINSMKDNYNIDFSDVHGQLHVKRGLEVAAAGGHNVLLLGPPGSGKSMLAQRLITILPDMTKEEKYETTKIYSVIGKSDKGIIACRPFRSPHHTSSDVALVGGGSVPKPGEVTLAHNGILFLDELPEFSRNVLESLRQPLEEHEVLVSRASQAVRFPARFMLIGAMNPCPCGWYLDPVKGCSCSSTQIQRYISKISGPLLDRIDIHLEVPSLRATELLVNKNQGESSYEIKKRTSSARIIQNNRFKNDNIFTNSQMDHRKVRQFCSIDSDGKKLLKAAIEELGLSARAHDKIMKVSRTIADLECEHSIMSKHISEAIQYRNLDRNWWG